MNFMIVLYQKVKLLYTDFLSCSFSFFIEGSSRTLREVDSIAFHLTLNLKSLLKSNIQESRDLFSIHVHDLFQYSYIIPKSQIIVHCLVQQSQQLYCTYYNSIQLHFLN